MSNAYTNKQSGYNDAINFMKINIDGVKDEEMVLVAQTLLKQLHCLIILIWSLLIQGEHAITHLVLWFLPTQL